MCDNGFVRGSDAAGTAFYLKDCRESVIQTRQGAKIGNLQLRFLFDHFGGNSRSGGDEFASVLGARLEQAGRSECHSRTGNGTCLRNNVAPTGLQNGCSGRKTG